MAKQRFVFLSDAHSVAPLLPIQKRMAAWCGDEIRTLAPERVILGGDLTHRPIPAQAAAFLDALGIADVPMDYLPGNNEGNAFPSAIRGCVRLDDTVFLLATSNAEEAGASVDALLERLPAEGACLVFAHFPPFLAGETGLRRLENAPVRIHWICGHRHEAMEYTNGNLCVIVCAGLDPVKVRGSLPELLEIGWDGEEASIRRIRVPQKILQSGRMPRHCAGVAFRGTAETILSAAIERRLPAIQFHYRHSSGTATEHEQALARAYREAVPGAFLSLHLPNFPHPAEGVDLADQEPWLQWAGEMGLDDLTIHLPDVPANYLFGADGAFLASEWAGNCLRVYAELSRRALQMGAQISFENVYNKVVHPPGAERLASQPWHLLRFVEAVRERVDAPADQREKIGIIFDAGHAFADAQFSKFHGLADWVSQVAPCLQVCHIHQVNERPDGKGRQNHQVIAESFGPFINFYGLLCALGDVPRRSLPLLIEVREQAAALQSYETLLATGLLETRGVEDGSWEIEDGGKIPYTYA